MRQRGVLREYSDTCFRPGNRYESRDRLLGMGLKDVGRSRCCAKLAGIWAKRADTIRVEVIGNPAALGGSPVGAVPRLQMVLVALRVRLSALFCAPNFILAPLVHSR